MPTFDGANKLITLDAPTSGVLDVNVEQDLYSDWKEWVLLSDNAKFLPAFRGAGGDPLTPGVEAGAYFFLRNDLGWRIISSDADQTVNYSGNLVGEDSSTTLINATPGRTVLHLGLQPVTQRVDELLSQSQVQSYNGEIIIDTLGNGISGTSYPIGTASVPVDNIIDAIAIAATLGFSRFLVRGDVILTTSPGRTQWQGLGNNSTLDLGGQNTSLTLFKELNVSGTMVSDGTTFFSDCTLFNITGFGGTASSCVLKGNLMLANNDVSLYNCLSGVPGTDSPIIDGLNEIAVSLTVRNYNGGIALENFTQGDAVATIGINAGRLNLTASCTDFGTLQIRGIGYLNNESPLTIGEDPADQISLSGFINAEDIDVMRAMIAGNAVVSVDDQTITVYDADATHVRATYSISADGRIRTRVS